MAGRYGARCVVWMVPYVAGCARAARRCNNICPLAYIASPLDPLVYGCYTVPGRVLLFGARFSEKIAFLASPCILSDPGGKSRCDFSGAWNRVSRPNFLHASDRSLARFSLPAYSYPRKQKSSSGCVAEQDCTG